jgi:hypothetical protein
MPVDTNTSTPNTTQINTINNCDRSGLSEAHLSMNLNTPVSPACNPLRVCAELSLPRQHARRKTDSPNLSPC